MKSQKKIKYQQLAPLRDGDARGGRGADAGGERGGEPDDGWRVGLRSGEGDAKGGTALGGVGDGQGQGGALQVESS